jgi:hypothetical protein
MKIARGVSTADTVQKSQRRVLGPDTWMGLMTQYCTNARMELFQVIVIHNNRLWAFAQRLRIWKGRRNRPESARFSALHVLLIKYTCTKPKFLKVSWGAIIGAEICLIFARKTGFLALGWDSSARKTIAKGNGTTVLLIRYTCKTTKLLGGSWEGKIGTGILLSLGLQNGISSTGQGLIHLQEKATESLNGNTIWAGQPLRL